MSAEQATDYDIMEKLLTIPGNVRDTYNRFYEYSWRNIGYLMLQGCPIEPINTLKRWNENFGRMIKTGASAYYISRPTFHKHENEDGEPVEVLTGFKPIKCIFPLSMTTGPELPPVVRPDWDLETALANLNMKRVPFEHIDGNVQGYSKGRNIAINPLARYGEKTAFHEAAHVYLGHTALENLVEYAEHRGLYEFEAEATAYMAMNERGLLTPEMAEVSRGYTQDYLHGQKPPESSLRRVFGAVEAILKAGRLAPAIGQIALTEPTE